MSWFRGVPRPWGAGPEGSGIHKACRAALRRLHLALYRLRYPSLLARVRRVDGWLTDIEAVTLYRLAAGLPAAHPVAVELGSWVGKSAIAIAAGLMHHRDAKLVCIDPFSGAGDEGSEADYRLRAGMIQNTLRQEFERNIQSAGVEGIVQVLPGFSHDYSRDFAEAIDLLFIDADHEYAAVARDLREWTRWVKAGGFVAVHDVASHCDGPRRAVAEMLNAGHGWQRIAQRDSLFVARRAAPDRDDPPSGGTRIAASL